MENNSKTYQFKTNINCSGCVAKVKPHMDGAQGISQWEVDTNNKDKVLTVKSDGMTQDQIMETVQKAGFRIELLKS
jgi:copper chaperone CopZ